jgi:hypothetical protein
MTLIMLTHFFLLLLRKVFTVNIGDLSEKGRKTYEYLPSIGEDRFVKDGRLSQVYRAMIEDKNQCQNQGQDQDQNQNQGQDQDQGQGQGEDQDQGGD